MLNTLWFWKYATSHRPQTEPRQIKIRDRSSHADEDAGTWTLRPGRVQTGPLDTYVPDWAVKNVSKILLGFFACGFGALHCLAWSSPFPTSTEKLAWRICSVTTTVLPALLLPLVEYQHRYNLCDMFEAYINRAQLLILALYVLGRAKIVVLAFMTLQMLPADAFQTVNWNDSLPHFAG